MVAADPVISEVRRAKTAIAKKYGFDVITMVKALRQIDDEEKVKIEAHPKGTRLLPPADASFRSGHG